MNADLQNQVHYRDEQIKVMQNTIKNQSQCPLGGRNDPEGNDVAQFKLDVAISMLVCGVAVQIVAAAVCLAVSTLRRYAMRAEKGLPLVQRRGPAPRTTICATPSSGILWPDGAHESRTSRVAARRTLADSV